MGRPSPDGAPVFVVTHEAPLLGDGIRYFGDLDVVPVLFESPRVIEADGVTHLTYRVRHPG